MRALGFQEQFIEGVLDGSKPFTMRRRWKRPEHMPEPGDQVQLVTGWRTPQRAVRGTARIAFRCRVTFGPEEILDLADWRAAPLTGPMAERVHDILIRAVDGHPFMSGAQPMRQFVAFDGFDSYEAFWAFHDRHRPRRAACLTMERELFGFDRVVREFG